jgi:hypothetical protein
MRFLSALLIVLGVGCVVAGIAQAGMHPFSAFSGSGEFNYFDPVAVGLGLCGLALLLVGASMALLRPRGRGTPSARRRASRRA